MTEKQYAPTKTEKKVSQKVETKHIEQSKKQPVKKEIKKKVVETKPKDEPKEQPKPTEVKQEENQKDDTKSKPEKKKVAAKKIVKKEEVVVNAKSLPISTKYAVNICKFIKGKKIEKAIEDLELVIVKKKFVPMKGEYAHKKGKGKAASGSGKYPKKASEHFIILLKSLEANARNHDVDEPVITEAIANLAQRPFGRFGRWRRKRTHVTIKARELKVKKKIRGKGK